MTVDIVDKSATLVDYTPHGTPPTHPSVEPGSVVVVNEIDDPRVLWVLWASCADERVYRITLNSDRSRLDVISTGCGSELGTHERHIRVWFSGAVPAGGIRPVHATFPTLKTLADPNERLPEGRGGGDQSP